MIADAAATCGEACSPDLHDRADRERRGLAAAQRAAHDLRLVTAAEVLDGEPARRAVERRVLAGDRLVLDDDVAGVHAPDGDARVPRQRNGANARRGADHDPRLARVLANRFDVRRLVELRYPYLPAVFVCAARPENCFLPCTFAGMSETPQTMSAPSLHA